MIEDREYIIENIFDLESLKAKYPNLSFTVLSPGIVRVIVPEAYEDEFKRLSEEKITTVTPTLYGLNAKEALQDSGILVFHDYPFGELRGKDVLIGFVDTGIDYTNSLFQYEDGTTRIVGIWDQTIPDPKQGPNAVGTLYTEEDINRALKSPDPYSIVPSKDDIGHGTFLAGVATGYDRIGSQAYEGGAPDAMLAIVKLKPAKSYLKRLYLIPENTLCYQDNHILAGIVYLINLAQKLEKPLALCIGVGNNYGGHDGSALLERYLRQVANLENLVVVVAAGNEANLGSHYSGKVEGGETQEFEINVAPNEPGFLMQLWVNSPDKVSIAIRSPIGQIIEKVNVAPQKQEEFTFSLQKTKIKVTYNYPEINTGDEYIEIRMEEPTQGIWTFTIYGDYIVDGSYNLWLPREGFIELGTRFLQPDPFITVCIPATTANIIVVGAYDYIDQSIFAASGRGPTRNDVMKPDLIAPGVNVSGPKPGGGYTTYIGTSTSAAITTAAAALLLEWAAVNKTLIKMNTQVAKTILTRGATRKNGVKYPNPIEGYGKLNLQNSLLLI
ncbi:MAG: S8 family peptidase [Cellulosilyticaceae bacterium]